MNDKLTNWTLFILLCFIWGSSFILMKISNRELTPYQVASLRIFSASVVFVPFVFSLLNNFSLKQAVLLAITGFFGNLFPAFCFAIAIYRIDSSLAGILNSLTPIFVLIIGYFVFREKINLQKFCGVLLGFTGLCLLAITQKNIGMQNAGYSAFILAATLSYGFNVNFVSRYLKDINPLQSTAFSLVFMGIPSALVLWQQNFFQSDFSDTRMQGAVLSCIVLGIAGSAFATFIFYTLVLRAGGLFASLVTYGIPFVALFWGIIDGESVSIITLICLFIILAGVYLAGRPGKKKAKPGVLRFINRKK